MKTLFAFCAFACIVGGFMVGFSVNEYLHIQSKKQPYQRHGYTVISADSIQYTNGTKALRTWPQK